MMVSSFFTWKLTRNPGIWRYFLCRKQLICLFVVQMTECRTSLPMADLERGKRTKILWSKSKLCLFKFLGSWNELNFVVASPCISFAYGIVVLFRCSLTFVFILLYREDSDDDDIEKGDNKMPRYMSNDDFPFSPQESFNFAPSCKLFSSWLVWR